MALRENQYQIFTRIVTLSPANMVFHNHICFYVYTNGQEKICMPLHPHKRGGDHLKRLGQGRANITAKDIGHHFKVQNF